MGWHHDATTGDWVAMVLLMTFLWTALAVGVVALVRTTRPARPEARDDARRILDERFARGELDEAEYTRRRELLGPQR